MTVNEKMKLVINLAEEALEKNVLCSPTIPPAFDRRRSVPSVRYVCPVHIMPMRLSWNFRMDMIQW